MSPPEKPSARPRWTGPFSSAGRETVISPHMVRALELAWDAVGRTSPNPPVGAVVVKGGCVAGEGNTRPAGEAHAEVVALRHAGEQAQGAALYVTLEPCSHQGRTPPCTDAIIAAGITEVHASTIDSNPRVSGTGLDRLREAGIAVHTGEGRNEAQELAAPHAKFITTGRPLVTAKFALSLDGKVATRTGDSKWITSEKSRRYVHELRARSDAILAGIGTVLADDPQLTARRPDGSPLPRQPLRVIVDSSGRLPLNSTLLRQPGSTLVAVAGESPTGRERLASAGADVFSATGVDGRVDLTELLDELGRRGAISVFVEGGGTLLGSLLDAGLVDRVVGFVAPMIIGGAAAPSPVGGTGVELMAQALRLVDVRVETFGDDVAISGWCSEIGG